MAESFRFESERLQGRLVELYELFEIAYERAPSGGLVVTDPGHEVLADDLQSAVRSWRMRSSWCVHCLRDEARADGMYERMALGWLEANGIDFELEYWGDECWALLADDPAVERALEELDDLDARRPRE